MAKSSGYPDRVALAKNATSKAPQDLFSDNDSGALFIALWAWNTSTLAYEKIENLNAKLDAIAASLVQIEINTRP